jgi:excisionase family DNA binding protein
MKRRPTPKPPAAEASPPSPSRAAPARYGSVKQVAAHFGVSERHVRRLIKKKKIPSIKVGGAVRIRWDDLEVT